MKFQVLQYFGTLRRVTISWVSSAIESPSSQGRDSFQIPRVGLLRCTQRAHFSYLNLSDLETAVALSAVPLMTLKNRHFGFVVLLRAVAKVLREQFRKFLFCFRPCKFGISCPIISLAILS